MNYQYTMIEEIKEGPFSSPEIVFNNRNSEKEILHTIGIKANRDINAPESKIIRIIRMDECGHVVFMDVVFEDGRLQLEAIPGEGCSNANRT